MNFFRRNKHDEEKRKKDVSSGESSAETYDAPLHPSTPPPPPRLPPPPPMPELGAGEYTSSDEHLWDELRRIDQLVRALTVRWRMTVGASKPEYLWGMVNVTEEEVAAYLRTLFTPPGTIPAEVESAVADYWRTADVLAESIAERVAQTPAEVTLRLEVLRRLFNLTNLERDILLVCLLPELDGRYRRLFGYLQDDVSRASPTVELALQILYRVAPDPEEARALFAASAPLVAKHLVVMSGDAAGHEPLPVRTVRIDDRLAAFLVGGDALDSRLAGFVGEDRERVRWEELSVEPEQLSKYRAAAGWWEALRAEERHGVTFFLHGAYGNGRLNVARAICTAVGLPLLVADAAATARSPSGHETAIDLVFREATLRGAALYWAGCEQLLEEGRPSHVWEYLVASAEDSRGPTFLASLTVWEPSGRFRAGHFMRLDFNAPGYELRRRVWEARLPPAEEFESPAPDRAALADQLANGFQLTDGQVADAVLAARELAAQRDPRQNALRVADLYEGCRRHSGRRLAAFARRVEPRSGLDFDDLILPPHNMRQLDELRFRIGQRYRVRGQFETRLTLGRGLIALFTGSSGTGKTMAAGLLAQEQGVDLYKVDLSAVVSKYVGETEKNLNRVFEEAEDANAVIFFDEGEALFGQRGSRTETGQDRWANMEVNYLLQRVEEYTGVVIIASNLRQNIDEAFMRRIHVLVEFPFPEADARTRIWLGMFPPGVRRPPDEEIARLAERFSLPGGGVSNVVVEAAFRALYEAGGGEPEITVRHLVLGVAREYQKTGKPITQSEFGDTFFRWVEEDILFTRVPEP
ncbi:MAG TPA: AAA family ATPase [Pyrinomonadaceae bacterium]|nr:AAA family ATPase [Pyrinomonadaceae bacterium]